MRTVWALDISTVHWFGFAVDINRSLNSDRQPHIEGMLGPVNQGLNICRIKHLPKIEGGQRDLSGCIGQGIFSLRLMGWLGGPRKRGLG